MKHKLCPGNGAKVGAWPRKLFVAAPQGVNSVPTRDHEMIKPVMAKMDSFAEWLKKKEYKIRVEVKKGEHVLSCPYFPPVTPWTEHSFLDVKNLELLPRLG